MKKILLVAFYILINIKSSFAKCSDLLRLEVKKRLGHELLYLIGPEAQSYFSKKNSFLIDRLNKFGTKEEILSKKKREPYLKLSQYLEFYQESTPDSFLISKLVDIMHDQSFVREWANDLLQYLMVELYATKSPKEISDFEDMREFKEELIFQALLERSKEGGFLGNQESVIVLDQILEEEDFGKVLQDKKQMYDLMFKKKSHGSIVHVLQMDLIIYAFKKLKLDPTKASYIYSFLGSTQSITFDNGGEFNPLNHGWKAIFDSFEKDLSSPENFNLLMLYYLDWYF